DVVGRLDRDEGDVGVLLRRFLGVLRDRRDPPVVGGRRGEADLHLATGPVVVRAAARGRGGRRALLRGRRLVARARADEGAGADDGPAEQEATASEASVLSRHGGSPWGWGVIAPMCVARPGRAAAA